MGNCLKSDSESSLIIPSDRQDSVHERAETSEPEPPTSQFGSDRRTSAYHPSPGFNRLASQQTEEEQVKIARRVGLIRHLPTGKYDDTNQQAKECVICMNEFTLGEQLKYLPCMHAYHKDCIDDWLMRSFTCPSCMEPVDAALLMTYQTGE